MGASCIDEDGFTVFDNRTATLCNNNTRSEHDLLEYYNDKVFIYMLPAIVYTAVMMTVGLPGNMVVFCVYLFKWRRSTSRTFILYLAALDMINCATTMPMEVYIMLFSFQMDQSFLCKVTRYSTYVMNSSSALILVGIATDRFKRICRPYDRPFTEIIAQRICIGAIVVSLGTTWPSLFLYGTRKINLGIAHGLTCLLENRYDETPYPMIFFCYMVSSTLVLFAVITILYYFIGVQIYRHRTFKLKNCTRVEQFIVEKSIPLETVKLKHELSVRAASSRNANENKIETISYGNDFKEAPSDDLQMSSQLRHPVSCIDIETNCGLPKTPRSNVCARFCNNKELIVLFKNGEANVTHVTHLNQAGHQSPRNQKLSVQNRNKIIRYQLVRGSPTLNAYGRTECVNCLTLRVGRSTSVLFVITIAYVLSFIPFYIIVIMRQTNTELEHGLLKGGRMAYHVFLRSYLLSSAINPFIYSFCNTQFRKYCKDTFACVLMRSKQS